MNKIHLRKLLFMCVAVLCALSLIIAVPKAQSKILMVNDDSPASYGDGSSWGKAIRRIETALFRADGGDTIYVAQGEYRERVVLPAGITLLGGFTTEGNTREITDPNNVFTTTINAVSAGIALTLGEATKVEGFKITKGNGSNYGGGIYCRGSNVMIVNNEICNNKALFGGGIGYAEGVNPTIINNKIHNNSAVNFGGAVAAINADGAIIFNDISSNTAGNGGGAIFCQMANPLIAHNTILSNSVAKDGGGAILCDFRSTPEIRNNVCAYNIAKGRGGAVHCKQASNASIINNTFYMDESIDYTSYGIYSDSTSEPYILNSIIMNEGFPAVKVSTIIDTIEYSMLISYMHEDDPLFVDEEKNDFHLDVGSPAKNAGMNGADLGAFGGVSGGKVGPEYVGIGVLEVFDRDVECLLEVQVDAVLSGEGLEVIIADTQELLAVVDGGSGFLEWQMETAAGIVDPRSIVLMKGENLLNLVVTDAMGTVREEMIMIMAGDRVAPVPSQSALQIIVGECFVEIEADQYPTAEDNCVEGLIIGSPMNTLIYDEQGEYAITWTYDDGNGNISEQVQTVIVRDTKAPVPDIANLPEVTGECSAEVSSVPTATDECCGPVTGTTTDPLSYDTPGTYTITWRFEDCNGNTGTQQQRVIVTDNEGPVPDAATLPDVTGECSVVVSSVPTATDECCGPVVGTTTDALSYDGEGQYTITWTFVDCAGNSTTQQQNVIVTACAPLDTTPPSVNAGSDKSVKEGAKVTLTAVASDDTTPAANLVYAWYEGNTKLSTSATLSKVFALGVHELRVEVTDEAGNKNSDTVKVTVSIPTPLPTPFDNWWTVRPKVPTWGDGAAVGWPTVTVPTTGWLLTPSTSYFGNTNATIIFPWK